MRNFKEPVKSLKMIEFDKALRLFREHDVKFIIIGGAAAIAHGSSRLTQDLDLLYARDEINLKNIVSALKGQHPYLRGAPPNLPFLWDIETLRQGLNFTLITDLGSIDLLGEIVGGGTYEKLLPNSSLISIFGTECRCLSLEQLIQTKQAAGRPKDLEAVAELKMIQQTVKS